MINNKPIYKPKNPNFSSGPTSKRPNWSLKQLEQAVLGWRYDKKAVLSRTCWISDKEAVPVGYRRRSCASARLKLHLLEVYKIYFLIY